EEDRLEADRDAQHEVQVVEDLEARIERTRRVERAAREAHPLELPEVPAKDLRDAERTARERARDARLDPRLLAAGRLVLRREHPPVLDHEVGVGVRAEERDRTCEPSGECDVVRVVEGDVGRRRGREAGVPRRCDPGVRAREVAHPWIGEPADEPRGVVGRAVVHDDHLERHALLVEDAREARAEHVGALVGRDDDGDVGRHAAASSAGTRTPLAPSSIISGIPPTALATIGRASAMPSRSASGNGSRVAGWTSTSSARTTGNGFARNPVTVTARSRPSAAIRPRTLASYAGSRKAPTRSARAAGTVARTRASASTSSAGFFRASRFPTMPTRGPAPSSPPGTGAVAARAMRSRSI